MFPLEFLCTRHSKAVLPVMRGRTALRSTERPRFSGTPGYTRATPETDNLDDSYSLYSVTLNPEVPKSGTAVGLRLTFGSESHSHRYWTELATSNWVWPHTRISFFDWVLHSTPRSRSHGLWLAFGLRITVQLSWDTPAAIIWPYTLACDLSAFLVSCFRLAYHNSRSAFLLNWVSNGPVKHVCVATPIRHYPGLFPSPNASHIGTHGGGECYSHQSQEQQCPIQPRSPISLLGFWGPLNNI
ncbi:hypothetical protein B0H17DRAFT_1147964 [Mycena rosella]|uniref:Uncharacterized protein n=1 Tax=Mycena rosella TaxID=1033263 RepID=A0AAD7G021_MYCRO|nr:hypothetical protein B0H17DRAFT_1147964 [Mycena rosella]